MNIFNINLNLLKSFWAVYETGGIIKAAGMLGMAPPTVTYNIKQLERQLGKKLFITHRKGADPTDDAKVLFPLVEGIFENLYKCNELFNTENKGTLRIGTPVFITDYIMAKFFQEFHKNYPSIELEFHYHPKHDYLTWLEEDKIDVAILHTTKRPSQQMEIFEVLRCKITFFTSKRFAAANDIDKEITVAQFMKLPFVCHSQSRTAVTKLENYFGQKLTVTEVGSALTAYGMVMDGQGIGVFFDEYISSQKSDPIVKFKIKDRPPLPTFIYECSYHKKPSTLITLFVKELKKFYSL